MAVAGRDPYTGEPFTGHEWNGIKELDTPVPRVVWLSLGLTALLSLVYWVLMPAWPLGVTYTKGLLGHDQRSWVEARLTEATTEQASWREPLRAASFGEIQADPALMAVVHTTGSRLFGDNCAVCHGADGGGGPGFPSLRDDAWLWGQGPESVAETLRVGINADHPETRIAQMPALGRDGVLPREDILNVVAFVQSLSDPAVAGGAQAEAVAAGAGVFADNCATCHGEGGAGNTDLGAPNLTDGFWIYGADRDSLYATVHGGRAGHMPHWEERLTELQRKILALYVVDLGSATE